MKHTLFLEAQAIWKILAIGLLLGAGLPALFAAGIRALAYGQGGAAEIQAAGTAAVPHPIGRAVAGLCFAIVIVAVVLGIVFIVASGFGKALSFEHIYPTIIDK
jgi:hypothetical protein